jgi:hypothetical protein
LGNPELSGDLRWFDARFEKTREENWVPLFDEAGAPLYTPFMATYIEFIPVWTRNPPFTAASRTSHWMLSEESVAATFVSFAINHPDTLCCTNPSVCPSKTATPFPCNRERVRTATCTQIEMRRGSSWQSATDWRLAGRHGRGFKVIGVAQTYEAPE